MRFLTLLFILFSICSLAQNTNIQPTSMSEKLIRHYNTSCRQLESYYPGVGYYKRVEISKIADSLEKNRTFLSRVDNFNLNYLKSESPLSIYKSNSSHKLPLGIYKSPANFFETTTNDFKLSINPAFNFQVGSSSNDKTLLYTNIRGIEIQGSINNRLNFYSFISENQLIPATHERDYKETFGAFPGAHMVKDYKNGAYDFLLASGYISFNALPAINIQFGQSRNFIGYGQRSLLLSDFATDYLFLRINTKIWRINYHNIYAKLIDNNEISLRPRASKYLTSHYLGINITDYWNLGFYEAVVFHDSEQTGRGFDFYYLNPVIFYRSVEHALGDADKVLMGLNTSWLPVKEMRLYGQFMLNEFRIKDLKERNGHSGNKFGYQLGLLWTNSFWISNLDISIEYNRVRPYSYTHKAIGQDTSAINNYSNYSQPLAHPFGANFSEVLATINYQPFPKINFEFNMISAAYGADSCNSNWGGNIFLDYTTAEQEYNNKVGQGVKTNLFIAEFITAWHIKHNLFLDLEFKYRKLQSEITDRNSKNIYIGTALRLNIWRRKWVY